MPKMKSRKIGLAFDSAGCPNRCRHCWVGCPPNACMSEETIRDVVGRFEAYEEPGANQPFFEALQVQTWYREPDFSPDYRRLRELELELSDVDLWGDLELLSLWRLARDEDYPAWAREWRGTKRCQISFFGIGANHDWFIRRRGAFDESLVATERLLEAGIIPRWQLFLTKPMVQDLPHLLDLSRKLQLSERTSALGGDFIIFIHTPSPDGEAMDIEHLRPTGRDIAAVPDWLVKATKRHVGGTDPFGEPEGALVRKVLSGGVDMPYQEPKHPAFFIDPGLNVYSNYGGPTSRCWRLGNLETHSVSEILEAFGNDTPPGLWAIYHVPIQEMAGTYGRRRGTRYFVPEDLQSRWVNLWCREQFPDMARA